MDEPIPFRVGDLVDWSPKIQEAFDHPVFEFPLVENHPRREFGEGPFRVVRVEMIPAGLLACGHYRRDPDHDMCRDMDILDRAEGKRVEDSDQTMRDACGHHQWIWIEVGPDNTAHQLTGAYFVIVERSLQQPKDPADDDDSCYADEDGPDGLPVQFGFGGGYTAADVLADQEEYEKQQAEREDREAAMNRAAARGNWLGVARLSLNDPDL